MRAVVFVIRPRGNQFDRIGAKDGQIAVVLFPLLDIPGIVRIGFLTVAQLMPA